MVIFGVYIFQSFNDFDSVWFNLILIRVSYLVKYKIFIPKVTIYTKIFCHLETAISNISKGSIYQSSLDKIQLLTFNNSIHFIQLLYTYPDLQNVDIIC